MKSYSKIIGRYQFTARYDTELTYITDKNGYKNSVMFGMLRVTKGTRIAYVLFIGSISLAVAWFKTKS